MRGLKAVLFREGWGSWAWLWLGVLWLTACTALTPTPSLTPTPTATPAPGYCALKVGVVSSLTGNYAGRAAALVRGYDLAAQQINARGGLLGCELVLVYRDDASQSEDVGALVTDLVEVEQVPVIIGSFSSQVTLKMLPLTERYRVPVLAHSATHDLITRQGYEWVFRTLSPSSDEVAQLLQYAVARPLDTDRPSMAIIYHDVAVGHNFAVTAFFEAKAAGIALVAAEAFNPAAEDFGPLLERVRAADPDIIFFSATNPQDGVRLLQGCEALDINPQIYLGVGTFNSAQFLAETPYSDYIITAAPWTAEVARMDMNGQTTRAFVQTFEAAYGSPPEYRSLDAYINVYIAAQAIEAAQQSLGRPWETVDSASARLAVRNALRELRMPQTLLGPIAFDSTGQNALELLLVQNRAGQLVVVYPVARQTGNVVFPAPPWSGRWGNEE